MDSRLDTDLTTGMEFFQQDVGSADQLLGGESFWMREIWPRSLIENGKIASQTVLHINIHSHCRCPSCDFKINDDQLMNGWTPSDVNFNSTCSRCSVTFSPLLRVVVYQRPNTGSTTTNRPQFSLIRAEASFDDNSSNKSTTSKTSPSENVEDPAGLLVSILSCPVSLKAINKI